MNIVIWIVIILVAVFLIWLLKRWIRRLIFIAILLIIAFFIYGLFSPSWAAKLWYNVRTFPDRIISRFSDKNFVDYNTYKLDFTAVWTKDKSDSKDKDLDIDSDTDLDDDRDSDLDSDIDLDLSNSSKKKDKSDSDQKQNGSDIEIIDNSENIEINERVTNQKNIWKSFWNLAPIRFVKMKEKLWDESEVKQDVSGYSKSDLIWIINTYIENNLTDDTEILVTIEYSETGEADKIILKTQPKYKDGDGVLSIPRLSLEKMIDWIYKSRYETVVIDDDVYEEDIDLDEDDEEVETKEKEVKKEDTKKEEIKKEENKEENEKEVKKEDTKKEVNKSDSYLEKISNSKNSLVVEVEWTKEEPKEEKKESNTATVSQPTAQKTTQTQTKTTTQKTTQTQPTTQKTTQTKTTQKTTQTQTKTTTQKTTQTQTKTTSNGLSQTDLRDAEEVLWALF